MVILRLQHAVPDFVAWKRAFDHDPLDRRASGVRQYRVYRPISDPTYVFVDLEFDSAAHAERMLERLRGLWSGVGGTVMRNPQAWVIETIEARVL